MKNKKTTAAGSLAALFGALAQYGVMPQFSIPLAAFFVALTGYLARDSGAASD